MIPGTISGSVTCYGGFRLLSAKSALKIGSPEVRVFSYASTTTSEEPHMRPAYRHALPLAICLLLAAASALAAPPVRTAKWTVMVYISGDNNLEHYVVKDIEQ